MMSFLTSEALLFWNFNYRDFPTTLVSTLFTVCAALAKQEADASAAQLYLHVVPSVLKWIFYMSLFVYQFTVGNQLYGVEEDRINKPNRPFPSGMLSISDGQRRWCVLMLLYLAVGCAFDVLMPTLLWLGLSLYHNIGRARHWVMKNAVCNGLGAFAQIWSSWQLVLLPDKSNNDSSHRMPGLYISLVVGIWVAATAHVQDFRDYAGDLASGRKTLPIVIGDERARILTVAVLQFASATASLLLAALVFSNNTASSMLLLLSWVAVQLTWAAAICCRLLLCRTPHADHVTYQLYSFQYCHLLSGGMLFLGSTPSWPMLVLYFGCIIAVWIVFLTPSENKAVPQTGDKNSTPLALAKQAIAQLSPEFGLKPDAVRRLEQMADYVCVGGKGYRTQIVLASATAFCKRNNLTFSQEMQRRSMIVGACIELMHCYFLVGDDIVDRSELRRGKPCWHVKPEVGMDALNDCFILSYMIPQLLKHHFAAAPLLCSALTTLFEKIALQSHLGQMADLSATKEPLDNFTLPYYEHIALNKTSAYTFYLPVAAAMTLTGCANAHSLAIARSLSGDIGTLFQVQDDFLDCFGDQKDTGKNGTDIKDRKLTWFIATCLERANEVQKLVLSQAFGKDKAEDVERVKALYEELGLRSAYRQYMQEKHKQLVAKIDSASCVIPKSVYGLILDKMLPRNS